MLAKDKATKTLGWAELEKKTLAEWDKWGMKVNNVMELKLTWQRKRALKEKQLSPHGTL